MIQAIWESVLNCLKEWKGTVKKGKVLLEHNQKNFEPCLMELNCVIVKLVGFQNTLYEEKIKDNKKYTVLAYLEKIVEMLRSEFDLKVCLSGQVVGTFNKRKMITYMWVTEPHLDERFLDSLPSKIED